MRLVRGRLLRRLPDLVLLGAVVLVALRWWLWVYLPGIDPGLEGKFGSIDLYAYFLPGFIHAQERLGAGEVPLWNPYEAFGVPFLGSLQVQALYPPRFLAFALFSPEAALDVYVRFHLVLGGVLSFCFLRARGRSPLAATLGASVFAVTLKPPAEPSQLACLAWLPAVIWGVERLFLAPSPRSIALAAAAVAMEFLGGYPEIGFDAGGALLLAVLVASVLRLGRPRVLLKSGGALLAMAVLATGLIAFQLLPFVEVVGQSWRMAAPHVTDLLARPRLALYSALPGVRSHLYFLGGTTLVLILVGALRIERDRLPLGISALFCLLAGSILWSWVHHFPLLRMSRASATWAIAYCAFAPIAAADALDWLWAPAAGRQRVLRLTVLLTAGCLVLWQINVVQHLPRRARYVTRQTGPERDWLVGSLAIAGAAIVLPLAEVRAAAGAFLVLEAVTDIWQIRPVAPFAPLVPRAIRDPSLAHALAEQLSHVPGRPRFVSGEITRTGGQLLARVEAATGYQDFLMPARIRELLRRFDLGSGGMVPVRWEALNAASGLRDAMNLRAALAPAALPVIHQWMAPFGWKRHSTIDGRELLLLDGGAPRAVLVHQGVLARDGEAALEAVLDPSFEPLRFAVVEAELPPLGAPPPDAKEAVTIVDYREERVDVAASVAAPALLVLSDSYYPGWEVEVDGSPQPILRANYVFRAVALEPGEHRVRFSYRPRPFAIGARLSLVALAVLALLAVYSPARAALRRIC